MLWEVWPVRVLALMFTKAPRPLVLPCPTGVPASVGVLAHHALWGPYF